jgi:hypothetical protein
VNRPRLVKLKVSRLQDEAWANKSNVSHIS